MSEDATLLAEGKRLKFVRKGTWEFVTRKSGPAVLIVAITDDDEVLLIEQPRVPAGATVLELPAGIRDEKDGGVEPAKDAAARELEEETGYRAGQLEELLADSTTSPGLTSETITIFKATSLSRVADKLGVEGEKITLHRVARADVRSWLEDRRREGKVLDVKVFAGLYLAGL